MPVQPVGECGRPSKVVWERAAHGGTVLGERHAAGMAACTGARAAGLRFARWGWGPSGVVPDSSATGLQGPLDSCRR